MTPNITQNQDGSFSITIPFSASNVQSQIDGLNSQITAIQAEIAPLQAQIDAYNALQASITAAYAAAHPEITP